MSSGRIVRTGAAPGLLVVGATVAALVGLGTGVLHLAPALLLFAALLARRYPGERRVVALVARSRCPRRRRGAPLRFATPRPGLVRPRGGLLLASALAERGPPVA